MSAQPPMRRVVVDLDRVTVETVERRNPARATHSSG